MRRPTILPYIGRPGMGFSHRAVTFERGRKPFFGETAAFVMEDSDAFVDLVHLASSLVDPKSEQPSADRLRTAIPAALAAMGNAPLEQIVAFVKSARAAGVRFSGSDEDVAISIKERANH